MVNDTIMTKNAIVQQNKKWFRYNCCDDCIKHDRNASSIGHSF